MRKSMNNISKHFERKAENYFFHGRQYQKALEIHMVIIKTVL